MTDTYCDPSDPSGTFLATPQFLSLALHSFGFVAIPVHLFGAYCILAKTPPSMDSIKWSLLNFHFWSCFVDLGLSLLTTPFVLVPLMAGYPLGILRFTWMTTADQTYFQVVSVVVMGVSIFGLFENRFLILSPANHWWHRVRVPWFILNYVVAVTFFYPVYYFIPEDQEAGKQYVIQILPCLSAEVKSAPIFLLADSTALFLRSGAAELAFLSFELGVLFVQITKSFDRYGRKLSRRTVNLQRKLIRALILQLLLPFFILVFPIVFLGISCWVKYHNQALNNLSFILISSHGFFSTIAMISVQAPYREEVLRLVFCGKRNIRKKSMTLNSINVQPLNIVAITK
ncbi:unnamed protein product [Caenorhabditis sp. 36 PRJEB53466]|nr:unnamed protein product [Caenorhabditis sp. 36 PRJEB53466]